MSFIQNVPFEYMDVDQVWNDRRDPHANPMSSSPRRMYDRAPSSSGLAKAVEGVYRPGVGDNEYQDRLSDKRLYEGQK
jgi:hypothetical protein